MKSMRKCTLCPSHQYEYCTICKKDSIVESWRLLFDSENCRDIYHILSEYAFNRKTAIEAYNELQKYNIPDKELIQTSLRKNYEDLLKEIKNRNSLINNSENLIENNDSSITEEQITKPKRRRYSRRNRE